MPVSNNSQALIKASPPRNIKMVIHFVMDSLLTNVFYFHQCSSISSVWTDLYIRPTHFHKISLLL